MQGEFYESKKAINFLLLFCYLFLISISIDQSQRWKLASAFDVASIYVLKVFFFLPDSTFFRGFLTF